MKTTVTPLIEAEAIADRLTELGAQLARDYQAEPPLLVGILHGCVPLLADLLRRIPLELDYVLMEWSSYCDRTSPQQAPQLRYAPPPQRITGRRVLVLDDICDTGATLQAACRWLQQQDAADTKSCVLALKTGVDRQVDRAPDYVGFFVPNTFIVGYGLDYAGRHRQLPYLGCLRIDDSGD